MVIRIDQRWINCSKIEQFHSNEIHVIRLQYNKLRTNLDFFQSLTNTTENKKALSYLSESDHNRSIITRGALRYVLSGLLNLNPDKISFTNSCFGKLRIKKNQNFQNIHFNITHSKDIGLIAINKNNYIGIDCEFIRKLFMMEEIAKKYFSDTEFKEFSILKDSEKIIGFYNCWTRKEAFVKAIGYGLIFPSKKFDVTLSPNSSPKISRIESDKFKIDDYTIHDIYPNENYIATVCYNITKTKISTWNFIVN